jgi:gas vesicle structural protein
MVRTMQPGGRGGNPSPSGLADVIETILDKGLVIDAYIRVSLVGIEVLTIDARIVVASVDTYLRFAEAVNRLDISQEKQGLPGLVGGMQQDGAKRKVKGVLEGVTETLRDFAESKAQHAAGRALRARRAVAGVPGRGGRRGEGIRVLRRAGRLDGRRRAVRVIRVDVPVPYPA